MTLILQDKLQRGRWTSQAAVSSWTIDILAGSKAIGKLYATFHDLVQAIPSEHTCLSNLTVFVYVMLSTLAFGNWVSRQ
eukprot:scaffold185900_cov34-Prasinocladus_malaysianus.AAC.3